MQNVRCGAHDVRLRDGALAEEGAMLFVLAGEIQTGKTRWLLRLLDDLRARGVEADGVVAPGVWRADGCGGFEKLAIENRLLPDGETVEFARRADLVEGAGKRCGWVFSDDAIARVNAHFERLRGGEGEAIAPARAVDRRTNVSRETFGAAGVRGRLLVVDELGWMELERDAGLTSALELLADGPTARWPHALVVVRADLVAAARARFEPAWGTARVILPDDAGAAAVAQAFSVDAE